VRKFSWLHTEFVPYMYSQVVTCHRGGPPLMRPLGEGKYQYLFGDDLLVAPIFEDKTARTVSLPPGSWRYLFADREVLPGPQRLTRDFPLDEFPVFVRDGAIIPLKVARPYTGFGDKESAEFTTWLIYPQGKNSFTLYHPETHPKPERTTVTVDLGAVLRIEFSGKKQPHLLRIWV
jgi:alpha-D-xyloside xylohydrolase